MNTIIRYVYFHCLFSKQKKILSLETQRLAKSFEGLNSSPAQSVEEMQMVSQLKYSWFIADFQVRYICRSAAKVLEANGNTLQQGCAFVQPCSTVGQNAHNQIGLSATLACVKLCGLDNLLAIRGKLAIL